MSPHSRSLPVHGVRCLLLAAALQATPGARAQFFQTTGGALPPPVAFAYEGVPIDIPDNSAVGAVSELTVAGVDALIHSVEVSLTLVGQVGDPAFNGDFHATLTHDSGHAILLNRVGRREGSSLGYGDGGFDVTLSDGAPSDVHVYRFALNGSHTVPLSIGDPPAPLTGTWQPDGRAVDPGLVLDTSARTATLSQFAGLDANGVWTLYVADLSPGGQGRLTHWGLSITLVPEPGAVALAAGMALVGFGVLRRRFVRRDP